MVLAASYRSTGISDLFDMHPLDRDFLAYWMRQKEYDQMEQYGRLLGVLFNVGEVRGWNEKGEHASLGMEDEDSLLVPLAFMMRPESRENIIKMVGQAGGLAPMQGYRKKDGEVIVDLGKVSPEDFKRFVEENRVDSLKG